MIHSIGVKELATEKTLSVDPTDLGVRVFMYNKALEERMHIELDLEDMIAVNRILEKRIRDLEEASRKPTAKEPHVNEVPQTALDHVDECMDVLHTSIMIGLHPEEASLGQWGVESQMSVVRSVKEDYKKLRDAIKALREE